MTLARILPALPLVLALACSHDWHTPDDDSGAENRTDPATAPAADSASSALDASVELPNAEPTTDAGATGDGQTDAAFAMGMRDAGDAAAADAAPTADGPLASADAASPDAQEAPVVRLTCPALSAPDQGFVSVPEAPLSGDSATFSCDGGRVAVGIARITCGDDGVWSGAVPRCEFVSCSAPEPPAHGSASVQGTASAGYTAIYACEPGYRLQGVGSADCLTGGQWSPGTRSCTPVACGALPAPENGRLDTSEGTTFGANARYACSVGYQLQGASTRTCGADMTWSASSPVCTALDCGALDAPVNGTVSAPATSYGKTASYACDVGYTPQGSTTRRCAATGSWDGSAPTCVAVNCGALVAVAHGSWSTPNGTSFGANAKLSCEADYFALGASERSCLGSGAWSATQPRCGKVLLREDFEDGSFSDKWTVDAGMFALTSATAANGSSKCLVQNGSGGNAHRGLHTLLPKDSRPSYVSWWTRVNAAGFYLGYFTACPDITHCMATEAPIWLFLDGTTGTILPGIVPYVTDSWVHLEMRDMDWTGRTAAFYVNGSAVMTLTLPGTGGLTRIDLYNFELHQVVPQTVATYWDEILVVE